MSKETEFSSSRRAASIPIRHALRGPHGPPQRTPPVALRATRDASGPAASGATHAYCPNRAALARLIVSAERRGARSADLRRSQIVRFAEPTNRPAPAIGPRCFSWHGLRRETAPRKWADRGPSPKRCSVRQALAGG